MLLNIIFVAFIYPLAGIFTTYKHFVRDIPIVIWHRILYILIFICYIVFISFMQKVFAVRHCDVIIISIVNQ